MSRYFNNGGNPHSPAWQRSEGKSESGGLNMQAVFFKAILIGVIFYLVKTYLL